MARIDELRLMTKVARMYYEEELRQSDIAKHIGNKPIEQIGH